MYKRFLCLFLAVLLVSLTALSLRASVMQRALAARLIRLHVVAASDDPADQTRKLAVRDALLPQIAALTADCTDAEHAAEALERALPALQRTAARTLGTGEPVAVSLAQEQFPRRDYETFSLPAGPYRSLRVRLGAAQGHNWWCVAFPALCLPATAEGFETEAEQAGLSESQIELMRADSPEVRFRFRLLDCLAALFGD